MEAGVVDKIGGAGRPVHTRVVLVARRKVDRGAIWFERRIDSMTSPRTRFRPGGTVAGEGNTEMRQGEAGLRLMCLWSLKGPLINGPGSQAGRCGLSRVTVSARPG